MRYLKGIKWHGNPKPTIISDSIFPPLPCLSKRLRCLWLLLWALQIFKPLLYNPIITELDLQFKPLIKCLPWIAFDWAWELRLKIFFRLKLHSFHFQGPHSAWKRWLHRHPQPAGLGIGWSPGQSGGGVRQHVLQLHTLHQLGQVVQSVRLWNWSVPSRVLYTVCPLTLPVYDDTISAKIYLGKSFTSDLEHCLSKYT